MVAAEVGDVFVLPGCNNGTPMQVVVCFSNILWIHMTMGYKRGIAWDKKYAVYWGRVMEFHGGLKTYFFFVNMSNGK